ncbi:MAG TPA: prephenate dehydratase [Planctomycetaceae bacterium]|nr:prephenate dehydratase [Planctomycetaceae bacterium]
MAKKTIAKSPVKKVAKKSPSKPTAKQRPVSRGTSAASKVPVRKAVSKKAARPSAGKPEKAKRTKPASVESQISVAPEIELAHLDEQLVGLLNKRASLYLQKMKGVQAPSKIVFSDLDQQQVWGMIDRLNQGPLTSAELKTIFRPLMSAGRQRIRSIRAAYLGPAFSFTHQAAILRFGEAADLVPVSTIATVFEEVNRGHVDFGLVPIENSTDGRIVDTLDMFTRLPLRICGEVQVHVYHNLLARCDRSEITEIYSKPQALSQCRDWLARNMPHARQIEVTSTSTAAQLARDKPNVAAVASHQAAVQYDVPIVAECIEDNQNNITRFAVIGDSVAKPTGSDRTAILLQIPHKPGSLSDALEAFRRNKINLTWIESFPLRQPAIGYLFFLDFEGHISEPRIKRTLNDLENLPPDRLEILGSYPRSEPLK